MPDYRKSKIYKIYSYQGGTNEIYFGSTCQSLSMRMAKHRSKYKSYNSATKKANTGRVSSFDLFDKYDDCIIELVENYPCRAKDELLAREGYFIRNNKCLNKIVAGRTQKQYRQENKVKIHEASRRYGQTHKAQISKQKKVDYQDNKAYREAKHSCSCGDDFTAQHRTRHMNTIRHKANLLNAHNIFNHL